MCRIEAEYRVNETNAVQLSGSCFLHTSKAPLTQLVYRGALVKMTVYYHMWHGGKSFRKVHSVNYPRWNLKAGFVCHLALAKCFSLPSDFINMMIIIQLYFWSKKMMLNCSCTWRKCDHKTVLLLISRPSVKMLHS